MSSEHPAALLHLHVNLHQANKHSAKMSATKAPSKHITIIANISPHGNQLPDTTHVTVVEKYLSVHDIMEVRIKEKSQNKSAKRPQET